jgi:hypothetical protein
VTDILWKCFLVGGAIGGWYAVFLTASHFFLGLGDDHEEE